MANIDNLNFKVILDDKDFNKKIKELEGIARQFNTNMTNALKLKGQSQNLSQKEVQARRRALQAAVDEARAQEKINREKIKTEGLQKKINAQVARTNRGSKQLASSISDISGMALKFFAFQGMASLVSSIVRITGEFELQKATLGAMLDDMAAAEHLITRIKGLAVESPFTFKELTGYAKQLTAFGVPKEELFETTNMIADLSAGLGVAADRLILAYGQVKSAAFLRGQEVRQFTEAGIPLLKELAEEFEKLEGRAVSVGEVFDRISTRQVSFEMVAKVLRDMTSEGGKFYNMQQIQADTLWGKMQKLKDQWQIALDEMGKKNGTIIHNTIDGLISLVKNWERVGNILRTVIITFGVYKATLLAVWAVQKLIAAWNIAKVLISAATSVHRLTAAFRMLKISMSSVLGVFGVIAGLITSLVINMRASKEASHDLNAELENMRDDSYALSIAFDADMERLKKLTRGTKSYRDAIQEINEAYGEYLPNLLNEADSYEKIEEAATHARQAIIESSRQQVRQKLEEERDRHMSSDNYIAFLREIEKEHAGLSSQLVSTYTKELVTTDKSIRQAFSDAYASLYDGARPIDISVLTQEAGDYIRSLDKWNRDIENVLKNLYDTAEWASADEYRVLTFKELDKKDALEELSNQQLSGEEYRIKALEIEKNYLREVAEYYERVGNLHMADKYRKELEELENFWTSWRGKVQDLLMNRDLTEYQSYGLWPTEYTGSKDYVDKLVKDYKEVKDSVEQLEFDPNTHAKVVEQKEVIEAIADLLNIDLTTGKSKTGSGKSELEKKIDALSALKKAYDSLKELNLSDSTIIQMLKDNFPDVVSTYGDGFIESLDFTNRILAFARELKATEPDKANSILQRLGLSDLDNDEKAIRKAVDAAKKYYEAIRKWQTSDFSIEGEGVAFDIGKIANQLSNKFRDIDLNAKKLTETLSQIDLNDATAVEAIKNTFEKEFGAGSWDIFYEEFVSKGEDAIKDFAQKEEDYERKLAQERLNDIADKYVKEALGNLDMSHWGDKTIGQIETIRQRIMSLMEEGIELPDSTIDKLNELGLSTEDLKVAIKELFGEKYDNATIEKFKALSKLINQVADYAKSLGSDLEKLGETMGSDALTGIGKGLQTFEELTKILTECNSLMQALGGSSKETGKNLEETGEDIDNIANSSDWVTMIIKLVLSLVSKVVEGINNSQKALREATEAAIEYGNALKQLEYDALRESSVSIFGTDDYRQAMDSIAKAKEYRDEISKLVDDLRKYVAVGELASQTTRDMWANAHPEYTAAELQSLLGIGDILVDARTGWQKFWGIGDELVKKVNIGEFLDAEGMLNGDKLREWLKANGEHISEYNKDMLTKMLNSYDLYVQALEDTQAYLQNIYGNTAESMADAYVEAFKASGEAALDYADIMDEVATNIAKSVVKSMILEEIASPEKIKEMSTLLLARDEVGAMEIFDETMRAAQEIAPYIQAFLEEMQPYFKMGEDDGQNLADGIKGLTEDTANLLASYLNAIRADVSYSKTLWERMDATTQQIAAALVGFSAPSLIDYQKKIEANTYNTQLYTNQILLELQSVITSDGGGGSAVRILS